MTEVVTSTKTKHKVVKTFDRQITPEDDRMVKRLVGYSEYMQALLHLDQLSRVMTDDERKGLDEYLVGNELFAVEANLAKELRSTHGAMDGEAEKRGLNWVTALARVELGAMLATYTQVPRPFEVVSPTSHDMDAYRHLLLDGVRTHYLAMRQDPNLENLFQQSQITKVLSYSRRLDMMKSMMQTLARMGWEWSPTEAKALRDWYVSLDDFEGSLKSYVQSYLRSTSSRQETMHTRKREYVGRYCTIIAEGMAKEVAAGTATVETSTESNPLGEPR